MKKTLLLLLAVCIAGISIGQKKTFMRIYDLHGKKFAKGFFGGTTDSSLLIIRSGKDFLPDPADSSLLTLQNGIITTSIPFTKIGFIKTKRSGGHFILLGSLAGIAGGAILGSIKPPTSSTGGLFTWAGTPRSEELASGVLFGTITGAIIGGIISLTKKRMTFTINGSRENWLQQKPLLDKIPVYKK